MRSAPLVIRQAHATINNCYSSVTIDKWLLLSTSRVFDDSRLRVCGVIQYWTSLAPSVGVLCFLLFISRSLLPRCFWRTLALLFFSAAFRHMPAGMCPVSAATLCTWGHERRRTCPLRYYSNDWKLRSPQGILQLYNASLTHTGNYARLGETGDAASRNDWVVLWRPTARGVRRCVNNQCG